MIDLRKLLEPKQPQANRIKKSERFPLVLMTCWYAVVRTEGLKPPMLIGSVSKMSSGSFPQDWQKKGTLPFPTLPACSPEQHRSLLWQGAGRPRSPCTRWTDGPTTGTGLSQIRPLVTGRWSGRLWACTQGDCCDRV